MNLNHWGNGVWANGSWVPSSWGSVGPTPPTPHPQSAGAGPGLGRRKKHHANTQIVFHGERQHRADTLEADLRRAVNRAFNVEDDAAPAAIEAAAEIRELVAPDYSKSSRPVVDLAALAEADERSRRILEIDATLRQLLAIKSGLGTLVELRAALESDMDDDDDAILLLMQW